MTQRSTKAFSSLNSFVCSVDHMFLLMSARAFSLCFLCFWPFKPGIVVTLHTHHIIRHFLQSHIRQTDHVGHCDAVMLIKDASNWHCSPRYWRAAMWTGLRAGPSSVQATAGCRGRKGCISTQPLFTVALTTKRIQRINPAYFSLGCFPWMGLLWLLYCWLCNRHLLSRNFGDSSNRASYSYRHCFCHHFCLLNPINPSFQGSIVARSKNIWSFLYNSPNYGHLLSEDLCIASLLRNLNL